MFEDFDYMCTGWIERADLKGACFSVHCTLGEVHFCGLISSLCALTSLRLNVLLVLVLSFGNLISQND